MKSELRIDREALHAPEEWDYRPFLRSAVATVRLADPKASFARLSKRFGLRSRSFLQHVIAGEKHFSIPTAEKAASALGLVGKDRTIFMGLVRLAGASGSERDRIRAAVKRARNKAKAKFVPSDVAARSSAIFANTTAMLAFAALGDSIRGASAEEVARRTALPLAKIQIEIAELERSGLVRSVEMEGSVRHFAIESYVLEDSPENREAFRRFYLDSAREAIRASESDFSSRDKLFSTYAFSVESKRMPEFRTRLGRLLDEFILEAEEANGDRVARLTISLT